LYGAIYVSLAVATSVPSVVYWKALPLKSASERNHARVDRYRTVVYRYLAPVPYPGVRSTPLICVIVGHHHPHPSSANGSSADHTPSTGLVVIRCSWCIVVRRFYRDVLVSPPLCGAIPRGNCAQETSPLKSASGGNVIAIRIYRYHSIALSDRHQAARVSEGQHH
jgi:hypothetical protein